MIRFEDRVNNDSGIFGEEERAFFDSLPDVYKTYPDHGFDEGEEE